MQTWPSGFPLPTQDFTGDVAANTVRTQMDSGMVRQRRRFTTDLLTLGVAWEFSDTELGVFLAFHRWRLNLGNDWFYISLPGDGVNVQQTVARFKEGKFTQTYQESMFWKVTASLEVQARNIFTEEVLDFYLGIGFSEDELTALITASNALHFSLNNVIQPNLN